MSTEAPDREDRSRMDDGEKSERPEQRAEEEPDAERAKAGHRGLPIR
jgi:hypothetical protein